MNFYLNNNNSNNFVNTKSKAPKKKEIRSDKKITTAVNLIVSSRVGQFTRLNSCFDSCKNVFSFSNIDVIRIYKSIQIYEYTNKILYSSFVD